MYWLALVRLLIWAPLSWLAAWGSTQTDEPWSIVLAVGSAVIALVLVANLFMALVFGPVSRLLMDKVVQGEVHERRAARPVDWLYRRWGA
jgi:hypothetical protein